jgi:hypothetical protein
VQQFVDVTGVAGRETMVDLMGMGKQPEDISVESPMFGAYRFGAARPAQEPAQRRQNRGGT